MVLLKHIDPSLLMAGHMHRELTLFPHLMLTKASSSPDSMVDPILQLADTLLQLDSEDSDPVHEYPWRINKMNPNKEL